MQIRKTKYFSLHFLGKIFLAMIFIAAIIQGLTYTFKLISGNYILSDNQIYMVDTFRLQGKAFYNSGHKFQTPSYDFSSTNGYHFVIDANTYKGIINKKQFADTFSYHELGFIAYSDKKTADKYLQESAPIFVNILQLKIGETEFISIDKRNNEYRGMLVRKLLLTIFLLSFVIIIYFRTGRIFE